MLGCKLTKMSSAHGTDTVLRYSMALLHATRHGLSQLVRLSAIRQSIPLTGTGPRWFSAEPAPVEAQDSITVTVNPFKGHRLNPPNRDVQTNKQELLDMFEVCGAHV